MTSRKDSHVKQLLRTDNVAIGYLPAIDKYAFYVRNWAPPPGQESRGPTRRIGLCLTDDLRDFGAPRDVFGLDAPADPSLPPTEVYTGGAFLYEGWWLFYPTFLAEFGPHEKVGAPDSSSKNDSALVQTLDMETGSWSNCSSARLRLDPEQSDPALSQEVAVQPGDALAALARAPTVSETHLPLPTKA